MHLFVIEQATLGNRKIGLGVMGFADLLIALRIPYDSPAAVDMADRVMGCIQAEAKTASSRLGYQRGNFPNFSKSTLARAWTHMRNATVTSIAPTGSISLIAGCSQGIEPVYSFFQKRRFFGGEERLLIHPAVTMERGADVCSAVTLSALAQEKTVIGCESNHLRSAHEVSADWQVRVQAAFQKHVDNGVSKTVNLPGSAEREDIRIVPDGGPQAWLQRGDGVSGWMQR